MIIQNLSSLRIEKRSALYLITDEVALSGEYVAIPLSTSQMRSIIVWNWGTNHYTKILLVRFTLASTSDMIILSRIFRGDATRSTA